MVDALIYFIVPAVVVVGALCLWRCRLDKDDSYLTTAYAALNSPSVRTARNAFDRRVALAVREAKQGAQECSGCGFTNVMRATSCVRCSGSLLPEKDRKATRASTPSKLQQRVRRRREWTRRVNDQGKLVWFHDDQVGSGAVVAGLPSYVLHSTSPPQYHAVAPCAQLLTTESHDDEYVEVIVSGEEDRAVAATTEAKTVAEVSTELQTAIQTTRTVITNATEADASCIAYANSRATINDQVMALSSTISPSSSLRIDTVTNAQLPFPSKLAEFITSIASLVGETNVAADAASLRLVLPRDELLKDSMAYLATIEPDAIRATIQVNFVGEQGIDAGGVYREWFLLLNEAIVIPEAGIFTCVNPDEQVFYLNPHSREILGEHHLAHFLAAGRLLGRALLDGNVTGFHLAMPLLKIILGQPVGFEDLQYYDPEVCNNLKWLLENDGVDALCLDFTVTEKLPDGRTCTVELVEGGAEIEVTDLNKVQFVDAKLKYLLFESVSEQLFAYLTGVYEVVPADLLAVFDVEELDYVFSGSDEIDVDDWEANTLTSNILKVHPSLEYFWKVVRELTTEERRCLLQFATGSTRVPPGGFCALTSHDGKLGLFNLRGVQPKITRGYLHSHACFNRLDLPLHSSVKRMRQAVLAALANESIGFTTA